MNRSLTVRRSIIGTVISILVFAYSAEPASATPPRFNPPKSYYLALGDSVTYGYQASKVGPGFAAEDLDTGYVDVFAAELRRIQPAIRVVNYGCPGESSTTFISGRCPVALVLEDGEVDGAAKGVFVFCRV